MESPLEGAVHSKLSIWDTSRLKAAVTNQGDEEPKAHLSGAACEICSVQLYQPPKILAWRPESNVQNMRKEFQFVTATDNIVYKLQLDVDECGDASVDLEASFLKILV